VKSAIDDFAEAYMDAWSAGEDKAASVGEVVRKMIKSAVTQFVKSRMSDEVKAFMNYLETAMTDGILTVAEQNTLDALEVAINDKLNGLDANLDKYIYRNEEKDNERKAVPKGIEAISQDSANEMNGRLTSIQHMTSEIHNNIKLLALNSQSILLAVTGIKDDTENLKRLGNIENDIRVVKNSISDISIKGIKLN
jgi:ABC-type phosphate transport system auxiliary subunit